MKYFSNFSKKKGKTALTTIDSSLKYLINFSDIDVSSLVMITVQEPFIQKVDNT